MRLYKNSDGVWAGTQVDARRMCGKGYSEVDVPTDKPNLLKFLNLNKVGAAEGAYEVLCDVGKQTEGDLNSKALSYFSWGYDKLQSGQYDEGKELIRKALLYKKTHDIHQEV